MPRPRMLGKSGEKSNKAKLSNEMVIQIKELLLQGEKHSDIAVWFKVSVSTINAISSGLTWRHIQLPKDVSDAAIEEMIRKISSRED